MKSFIIKGYKKDGSEMIPTKIIDGIWIEPHEKKQKDIIYYHGTLIPHKYYMEIKKDDPYNHLKGCCPPWTHPESIKINEELFKIKNIYEEFLTAKKENNKEKLDFLSSPLLSWKCPMTNKRKSMYSPAIAISNRNDKSNFVYENLDRFETAMAELTVIYLSKRLNTKSGIAALINLLSAKMAFRVGNTEKGDKVGNTGIGVTTFKPKNITINNNKVSFKFKGKKGVQWNKTLIAKTDLEKLIIEDLQKLKDNDDEYLFIWGGKRVHSGDANEMFRKVLKMQPEEKSFLSFHSWRHFLASRAFLKELNKIKISKDIKKIEEKNDINMTIKKGRLITREINQVFKKVAKVLNDTPGVVKTTYSGGKIFRDFYGKHGVSYDEKTRNWNKEVHSDEIAAERERCIEKKKEREEKKRINLKRDKIIKILTKDLEDDKKIKEIKRNIKRYFNDFPEVCKSKTTEELISLFGG